MRKVTHNGGNIMDRDTLIDGIATVIGIGIVVLSLAFL